MPISCLRAAIRVCDQACLWSAQAVGHLERVEHELGTHVRCELPPDDPSAVAVEDEGEVDEAVPCSDVGEIGDPFLVRAARGEVALQEITGTSAAASSGIVVRFFEPRTG